MAPLFLLSEDRCKLFVDQIQLPAFWVCQRLISSAPLAFFLFFLVTSSFLSPPNIAQPRVPSLARTSRRTIPLLPPLKDTRLLPGIGIFFLSHIENLLFPPEGIAAMNASCLRRPFWKFPPFFSLKLYDLSSHSFFSRQRSSF